LSSQFAELKTSSPTLNCTTVQRGSLLTMMDMYAEII